MFQKQKDEEPNKNEGFDTEEILEYVYHFLNLKREDNSFLTSLLNESNHHELLVLIGNYANEVYEEIKRILHYRIDDSTPFTTILSDNDNLEKVLFIINEGLNSREELHKYRNFLNDLSEMVGLVENLHEFNERSLKLMQLPKQLVQDQSPIEALRFIPELREEFEKYQKNTSRLIILLHKTKHPSILSYLKKFSGINDYCEKQFRYELIPFDNHMSEGKELKVSKVKRKFNSLTIFIEPDWAYRLVTRSIGENVVNYIRTNRKKIIFGGLIGAIGCGSVAAISCPFVIPSIAALLIIISILGGGFFGISATAILHHLINKEVRENTFGAKRVGVNLNSLEYSLGDSEEMPLQTCQTNTTQYLQERMDKENLARFLFLINGSVPINLLLSLNKTDLISQIRSLAKSCQDPSALFELAKKYLVSKNNLLLNIDFQQLAKSCTEDWVPFELGKHLNIKWLELQFLGIKYQAFLHLLRKGQIYQKHLKQINEEQCRLLKVRIDAIDPLELANSYYAILCKNKQNAEQLMELYAQFCQSKVTKVENERKRIRNTLEFFIARLLTKANLSEIKSGELLTFFLNALRETGRERISEIYLELISTASLTIFSFDLMPIFKNYIKNCAELFSNPKVTEQEEFLLKKQSLFDAVHLFLNSVTNLANLPLTCQARQKMSIFYHTLETLEVSKIVKIFSELRFNKFVELDLQKLNDLIVEFYRQTDSEKLKLFNEEILLINSAEFVKTNTQPLVIILKHFLGNIDSLNRLSIQNMTLKKLLPIFFDTLNQLKNEGIITIIHSIASELPEFNERLSFLSHIIFNYLEFNRPDELVDFKERVLNFKSDFNPYALARYVNNVEDLTAEQEAVTPISSFCTNLN